MPSNDPLGQGGPTLDEFLVKDLSDLKGSRVSKASSSSINKCTFGPFLQSGTRATDQESVSQILLRLYIVNCPTKIVQEQLVIPHLEPRAQCMNRRVAQAIQAIPDLQWHAELPRRQPLLQADFLVHIVVRGIRTTQDPSRHQAKVSCLLRNLMYPVMSFSFSDIQQTIKVHLPPNLRLSGRRPRRQSQELQNPREC